MDLKRFHKLEIAVRVAVILLAFLWLLLKKAGVEPAAQVIAWVVVILAIAWSILALIFRRCPHCHSFFRRYRRFCGQCGKELDW